MEIDTEKIILDLCGGTGAWSKPYRDAGYDVKNITLPEHDVRLFQKPREPIWGILAAPPCDHLASSGARWFKGKTNAALIHALSIVDACLRIIWVSNPHFWCLENPVGRLTRYLGKPTMYFDPCDYGDPYTKKTALWGKFNPPKKNPVEPREGSKIAKFAPSANRKELRAITPPGFAQAFFRANQ